MRTKYTRILVLIAVTIAAVSVASAQTYYWDGGTIDIVGNGDGLSNGGAGTWNTSITNWDVGSGVPRAAWDNGSNGVAVIAGTAGTVTVATNINISKLDIKTANYTVSGNGSLDFSAGGIITNTGTGTITISCPISGSPDVRQFVGNNQWLKFAPTSGSQALGVIYRHTDDYLELNGSTTGNTVNSIVVPAGGDARSKVYFKGTGAWTVGDIKTGDFQLSSGVLVMTGTLTKGNNGHYLKGGTMHFNNVNGDVIGENNFFRFQGGAFDNTIGSPVTGSTLNNGYYLEKDTTFIGSLGTNSDLHLGTGAATLNVTTPLRTDVDMTVSNALTTLTIGGAVGDGTNSYGLAKSGAGRLVLMGANTYNGATIVREGILDVRDAGSLANCSAIQIKAEGTLRLENADNSGSPWDFAALSSLNSNLLAGFNAGTGSNLTFSNIVAGFTDIGADIPNPDSTAYWDGNDTTGNADGGAGIWNGTNTNWDDAETGGSSIAWDANSSSNDTAIFKGSGGLVQLDSDIYVRRIEIYPVNYQIGTDTETHVLRFVDPDPRITMYENNIKIKAGITGSPEVVISRGSNQNFYLEPGAEPMTLGWIRRLTDEWLYLGGTNTGNTALGMTTINTDTKLRKRGSGTWTFNGPVTSGREITIYDSGKLVLNGLTTMTSGYNLTFDGSSSGTLAGTGILTNITVRTITVPANCTIAPGDPTGTFTIANGNCTISGTMAVTVDGTGHSRLLVDGVLALDPATSTLSVDPAGASGNQFVIATFDSLSNSVPFAVTNGLPSSWQVVYEATQIKLVPPPSGTVIMFK